MKHLSLLVITIVFAANLKANEPNPSKTQVIRYFQIDQRYNYSFKLLKLILEETTDQYGPYQLRPVRNTDYLRGTALLTHGENMDVMVSGPNKELLANLYPILEPIEQGLLGYRLFFIHSDNIEAFREVSQLRGLKQRFMAGFGANWVDRKILEANNIPLIPHPSYPQLYKMLMGKRFDYFPRGINEIDHELTVFQKTYPQLTIEDSLAFYYPYPRYFFVSRNNQTLQQRLSEGFQRIKESGVFQKHFEKFHKKTLTRIKRENRRVFYLHNPLLPEGIPVPDTSNWLPKENIHY